MSDRHLLIIAHAPSPNTLAMRDAVLRGASEAAGKELMVKVLSPFDADPEDVLAASGLVLGTTENLGYMSGALKDFFDRIYYPCLDQTDGLSYALYVRAGHDGTGTRRAVESITTGLRWREVQDPLICRGGWRPEFADQCGELGAAMAAGIVMGIF